MMGERTALILGATGLVGGHCVRALLAHPAYARIVALVRRPLPDDDPRLVQRVIDFEALDAAGPFDATDVFCALGTTLAKAGSEEAFFRVDHGIPQAVAERAARAGAKRFVLVSAAGADPRSTSSYLRVKGELEQSLEALPFASLHILRPSLLLGERGDLRKGEEIGAAAAQTLRFTTKGGLRNYRPVDAATVAAAMVAAAQQNVQGTIVYHFDDLIALASSLR